jgi:type IV secretory pathway VirB9-like protein
MLMIAHFERNHVKKSILVFVTTSGLAMAADTRSPQPLTPSAPRTLVVLDTETPPLIRAGLLQSTLIVLPQEEKVATVFGGDTVQWVFDGGHVPSRFISIKPRVANASTDVHIVSDHGNEYTFQLKEITSDSDTHFDSKVFVQPGSIQAKEKLIQMPVFVPAAEVQEKLTTLQKEADAAKAAAEKERKEAQTAAEQYRSAYPGKLHFDYAWDHKTADKLGLQEIWRDDKFTYLRGHFQETPALYELKDGKGSLINFDFANGLYTVPKQLEQGYLAIGKQRMDFRRTGEGE